MTCDIVALSASLTKHLSGDAAVQSVIFIRPSAELPTAEFMTVPVLFGDINSVSRTVQRFSQNLRVQLNQLRSSDSDDNLLELLMDNRVVFESILESLGKSDRHHFLRVVPLPFRSKLLHEYPSLFDNAPLTRKHWIWFSEHWLDLLDGKKWVVEYWYDGLKRSEAVDIWHALPAKLRSNLAESLQLNSYTGVLRERMPFLDWDRLIGELKMLESVREAWFSAGIAPEAALDENIDDEDEEFHQQYEEALQTSVQILWPYLLSNERFDIWQSMKEAPEMEAFCTFLSDRVPRKLVLEALSSSAQDASTPGGFLKHLWPLLKEHKELRKSFLEEIFPVIKPEWSTVFDPNAREILPKQILNDILQMDEFDDDLLSERLWAHKDARVRLALVGSRLRLQTDSFEQLILQGDRETKSLSFVALGNVSATALEYIGNLDCPWSYIADKPLNAVWQALTPDERVKAFLSLAYVSEDLIQQTNTIIQVAQVMPDTMKRIAKKTFSFQFFISHLWPLLNTSTRRAAYMLWRLDWNLEDIIKEVPKRIFSRAPDIEEAEEQLWQSLEVDQRVEWLEVIYGEQAVPALLKSLTDIASTDTGADIIQAFLAAKEPKVEVIADHIWPHLNHIIRDSFLRHSGLYSDQFRTLYQTLSADLVVHFLSSPSPHAQNIVFHAWKHIPEHLRPQFVGAIFSIGPLESLFANDNNGEHKLPSSVVS